MAFGFLSKLKEGLDKTRKGITDKIDDLFNNYGEIDDELFDELEEILIMADVGIPTTHKLIERLRSELKVRKIKDARDVKVVFKEVVEEMLRENNSVPFHVGDVPTIVMVIGVNGVGKTTSIGKIAHLIKSEGKSVLIAAADTFRAAAIDQLKVWGDRVGVHVVHQSEGSDPAAVIFDAIQSDKEKKNRCIDLRYGWKTTQQSKSDERAC